MMLQETDTIPILIALADPSVTEIVKQTLSAYHPIILFDKGLMESAIPNVCIVDLATWAELDSRVKNRHPNRLYRLLVVDGDSFNYLPAHIQDDVDDIIITPLRPAELQIRLQSILQTHQYASRMQGIYERLSTTNQALESTSDAIVITDADGNVTYVNPAFIRLFGYDVKRLNDTGIIHVLFQEQSLGAQVFHHVRENGTWKGEVDLRTSNDKILPFLLNVDHILNERNDPIGLIIICTDITLHKIVSTIQEEQRISAEAQLDTARALSSTLDLDEVFDRMLDNINRVVPNDVANVIIIEGQRAMMVDRNDYSEQGDVIKKLKNGDIPVSYFDDLRRILQTNHPLVVSNTEYYLENHDDMRTRSPWLKSHIGIPIRLKDEIIGFLNVDSNQPGLFQPIHAERLQIFAEQAAIAIHNARLHKNAQKLAMIEERQRLARNLHDAVSQILFSASIIAEALPSLWERDPSAVFPRLEQIQRLTRGALAEMRSLLIELNPDRFLETEIDILLQQLREGVLGHTHIDVTLKVDKGLDLPANIKIAIYYITQEALNNIVKHAEANKAVIQLAKQTGELELTVCDDGKGFDKETIASTSFGLDNMHVRADTTDAKLTITSEIGIGTTISVKWFI